MALFPAVGLGGALLAGGAGGCALGAMAGHVAGGMGRGDLKELGELLDDGQSGLIAIAASDVEARVEDAISRAAKLEKKDLQADQQALEAEIDDAARS